MNLPLCRIDIVSIFDLRFSRADRIPWPPISPDNPHSCIASRLSESFRWNFYGNNIEGFQLFDLSQAVSGATGAGLRINPESRIGTLLIWRSYNSQSDPHTLKAQAWEESGKDSALLAPVFRELRIDRIYPFLAIQIDTDEDTLDSVAEANAEELGRLLTGDLEGERASTLKHYIDADLSRRAYEKLFLRWTEALAVYSRQDDKIYENCMFRAVQIFEHCILAQVSLISIMERMDSFSRRLILVTPFNWLSSRGLFTAFASAEMRFIVYPRTQSVEANRLLTDAQSQFGLPAFLASAKSKAAEVLEQFQWAKTQTLALIAVTTYVLDKIVGWDYVKHWLATLFH